jgi:D-aminopeptidase
VVINELRINGRVASESILSALTAEHSKMAEIMVSGDDMKVEQAQNELSAADNPLETTTTKWCYSTSGACMIKHSTVQE